MTDPAPPRNPIRASLIISAKLNDADPRAWLADVLRRIAGHPASCLHELLPWNWRKTAQDTAAAA